MCGGEGKRKSPNACEGDDGYEGGACPQYFCGVGGVVKEKGVSVSDTFKVWGRGGPDACGSGCLLREMGRLGELYLNTDLGTL